MSEERNRPSKWWFWGVVLLATGYPVLLLVVFMVDQLTGIRAASYLFQVVFTPALFFVERVVVRVSPHYPENFGHSPLLVWLPVMLWELGAVVLGLACYGGAALTRAAVQPCGKRSRERQDEWLSKWWFWAFPLLGLWHFAMATVMTPWLYSRLPLSGWLLVVACVFVYPVLLFSEYVFAPVWYLLGGPSHGLLRVLVGLALWEGCWALLGLMVYGVMAQRCRRKPQEADGAAASKGDD